MTFDIVEEGILSAEYAKNPPINTYNLMYDSLKMCLEALYEAVDIAPLDRLPSKAPSAIQQAQYVLNQVDGGSR